MHFDRAMSLLLAGYSVRRASWLGREDAEGKILERAIVPSEHGFCFSGRRTIFGREQEFAFALSLHSKDIAADDWEVASQPVDSDALKALRAMLRLFDDQGNMIADFPTMQEAITDGFKVLSTNQGSRSDD